MMLFADTAAAESEQVTRTILDNVPSWLSTGFYVAAFTALAWAAYGYYRRAIVRRSGRPDGAKINRSRSLGAMVVDCVKYLTFHRELLRDPFAGVAHLLLFYGFVILFIGTCLVFLEH